MTAVAVSAGRLILTSWVNNTDAPCTFAAALTVRGEADQTSIESGVCTIGGISVAPDDRIDIFGDSGVGVGSTSSILETNTIDQKPGGTGTCTYTANFDAVPANQKSYDVSLGNGFPGRLSRLTNSGMTPPVSCTETDGGRFRHSSSGKRRLHSGWSANDRLRATNRPESTL